MELSKKQLFKKLKFLRSYRGWTQENVAEKSGISLLNFKCARYALHSCHLFYNNFFMNLEKHLFKSDSFQELINEAISFFCSTPMESLPPDDNFAGAGVYALYYKGNLTIYQAIYEKKPEIPIYVGKAVLPGWRQGRTTTKENEPALYRRLKEHSRSISAANNLDLDDFY